MLRYLLTVTCVSGLLFCKAVGPNAVAADAQWPGWLGPQRDGWVDHFQIPDPWPEELQRRWQVEVGTGYGSPVVADDRVYQHARQGENEVLWCLELQTGNVLWQQSEPVPFKMGGGGEWHGKGPKSSPALADGRVFTMSITGVLTAWDAESGTQLWRSDYGSRFKSTHPYWGTATSPIVVGNKVIVHFGTDDEGALVALDVATGQEIWSHSKDGASYSSPVLATLEGVQQVVEWNHRAVVGVDSETGQQLWEHPFPHVGSNQNMPTPVIHQGLVLVGGENRGIVCLQPQLANGEWTVQQHWHQESVALDMSSAVINNDLLFGFSHYGSGRFFCLDPQSGEVLWQGPGRTGQNVMFLAIPDHVLALVDNGRIQIIRASGDSYQQVAAYTVSQQPTWAPPVLLTDSLLIKDQNTLALWTLAPRERSAER